MIKKVFVRILIVLAVLAFIYMQLMTVKEQSKDVQREMRYR